MSNENAVRNLIRNDDKMKPIMVRALQLLIDDLYKINEKIFPAKSADLEDQTSIGSKLVGPVENFLAVAYPDNLRLDWDDLTGAFRYQIKLGHEWETARHIITTATDVANIDPIYLNLIYGDYNFLIRAMNIDGKLGLAAGALLTVSPIPPPELSLEVVVSTVLLRWTVPTSDWRIDHYIIYKDSVEIGTINGTFKLIQEQAGGTYAYSVRAVDIVGNLGLMSAIKIADLHDPSEFEFVDELQADYTGIYIRTQRILIGGIVGVIGPILSPMTWQEHFVNFGFASPQAQVDAGYPIYYQPTSTTPGSYEEIFDFGAVYEGITVVVDYNKQQLHGFTTLTTELSYSEDGITYSTPVPGISVLADVFRYVKVKWMFDNGVDDHSAAFISNLKVVLNITLTIDSGSTDCFAADVGGTLITYNKTFTGISSITATPATSMQPLYAVCDNVNKDNFRVLVFDSSGNRVNATIDWKCRGVV